MKSCVIKFFATFCIIFSTKIQSIYCGRIDIECKNINYADPNDGLTKSKKLDLSYDRDSVEIFLYNLTPSINIFIRNASVFIDPGTNNKRVAEAKIIGVANISKDRMLKDCALFVRTAGNDTKKIVPPGSLTEAFDKCVTSDICKKLVPQQQDIERARGSTFPLESLSLLSWSVFETYPNLIRPSAPTAKPAEKTENKDQLSYPKD